LDLASKIDLCALEILIELDDETFVRFGKYYVPEAAVFDNEKNEHYRNWAKEGWITVTDGEVTDYDFIIEDLDELKSLLQLEVILYDPFQATYLATTLIKDGFPMMEYGQTVLNMSEPMKQLDADIRDGKIKHNGDPVQTWALSNVVAKEDKKENVFPNKPIQQSKIDPAVALIMARAAKLHDLSANTTSAWETQDLVIG